MPSDLDQLAQDADHQNQWGTPPTGNDLQDLAGQQQMTHQPDRPNPAQPYLDWLSGAARKTFIDPMQAAGFLPGGQNWGRPAVEGMMNFEQGGLTGVNPSLRNVMPGGANTLGNLVQSPSARSVFSSANLGGLPLAQAIVPAAGRGFIIKPESRAYFNSSIGKTIPEPEFLQRYWAGYDNPSRPNVALTYFQDEKDLGHRISVSGNLVKNGQTVGTMQRVIKPEEGYSYHAGLHIDPDFRRQGIAKNIYRNQRDVYRQIGVNRVGILADEDGAHVWGNFGYKPLTSEWIRNRHMYMNRVNRLDWMSKTGQAEITPADVEYMKRIINSDDPRGNWLLSDMDIPLVVSRRDEDGIMRMEESTAGREVLRDLPWNGEMNYKDPEQVRRQNDFLK